MKKWFARVAIFLSVYVVFLIATLPAPWVMSYVKLPPNTQLTGVTGTIWQSNIDKVQVGRVIVNDVTSELSVLSVLMFNPKFTMNFGGPLVNGPEGELEISQLLGDIQAENLKVTLLANTIAEHMNLALPVEAHNYVDIRIDNYLAGQGMCQELSGDIKWQKAQVTVLDEKVDLGKLSAVLSCEKGTLAITLDPKNNLGLTFTGYLAKLNRFTGDGVLKPGANFPEKIKPVLPFIGQPDSQGRYRINF